MVETLDNGKPYRETRGADVPLSADHFRYFAGVIGSEEGTAKGLDEDNLTLTLQEPIGGCWKNYSMEFSNSNGCLENCTCNRCRKYCRHSSFV